MKLCIPTEDSAGLDARVYEHFGSAPFFTVVDTDTEDIELVNNRDLAHPHGACNPVSSIESRAIDAVVCGGLGKRALARLQQAGFKVYLSQAGTVRDVVAEQRGGTLREATIEEACGGHAHGHGQGHGPLGEGRGQTQRHKERQRGKGGGQRGPGAGGVRGGGGSQGRGGGGGQVRRSGQSGGLGGREGRGRSGGGQGEGRGRGHGGNGQGRGGGR
jgi:predicted Fe-Mo cluster-binding NifX family protein